MEEYLRRHQAAYKSRTEQRSQTEQDDNELNNSTTDLNYNTALNTSAYTTSSKPNSYLNNEDIDIDESKTDPELASELLCQKLQNEINSQPQDVYSGEDSGIRPPDSSFSECLFEGSYWRPNRQEPTHDPSEHSEQSTLDPDEHDESLQAAIRQSLIEM